MAVLLVECLNLSSLSCRGSLPTFMPVYGRGCGVEEKEGSEEDVVNAWDEQHESDREGEGLRL